MEPSTSNITCNTSAQQFNASYCSKTRIPFQPIRTIEEGVRIIGEILNKNVLCRHDVEDINETYRSIDRFGRSLHLFERSNQQISVVYTSLHALQKIIDKVEQIAFNEKITSGALISLYHMQNYSKLPIHKYFALSLSKFDKTQKNIEELAKHLPCCFSVAEFDKDVKVLIPNRPAEVANILNRKRELLLVFERGEAIDRAFYSVQMSLESIDDLKTSIQNRITNVRSVYGEEQWDERVSFLADKLAIKNFNRKNRACVPAYAYSLIEPGLSRVCEPMDNIEASAETGAFALAKLFSIIPAERRTLEVYGGKLIGQRYFAWADPDEVAEARASAVGWAEAEVQRLKRHLLTWAEANEVAMAEANEVAMAVASAVVWAEAEEGYSRWEGDPSFLSLGRQILEGLSSHPFDLSYAMEDKISCCSMVGIVPCSFGWSVDDNGSQRLEAIKTIKKETDAMAMALVKTDAEERARAKAQATADGIAKIAKAVAIAIAMQETSAREKLEAIAMAMLETRARAMVNVALIRRSANERVRTIESRGYDIPKAAMEASIRALAMAKEAIRVEEEIEAEQRGRPRNIFSRTARPVIIAWEKREEEVWAEAVEKGYANVTWAVNKRWAVEWGMLVAKAWVSTQARANQKEETMEQQEKKLSEDLVRQWKGGMMWAEKVVKARIWAEKVVKAWARPKTLIRTMTMDDAMRYSHAFKLSIHRELDHSTMIEIHGVGDMPELVMPDNSEFCSNNTLLNRVLSAAALHIAH